MSSTEQTDADRLIQEATELGHSRGWDHANFVAAYGKQHDRRTPDYPGWLGIDPNAEGISYEERRARIYQRAERVAAHNAFKAAWSEGRKRFARGRYPDGTKIED